MNVEPAARINLRWIVRLRWGAVGGQVITILLAGRFLDSPLPLGAMLAVCGALALGNVLVQVWLDQGGRPTDRACALNLLADIAELTALLALSGGRENPFAVLFLVHITIGAVLGRGEAQLDLLEHLRARAIDLLRRRWLRDHALDRRQQEVSRFIECPASLGWARPDADASSPSWWRRRSSPPSLSG